MIEYNMLFSDLTCQGGGCFTDYCSKLEITTVLFVGQVMSDISEQDCIVTQ